MKRTSFRTAAAPARLPRPRPRPHRLRRGQRGALGATPSPSDGPKLSGTLNGAGSSAQEAAQGAWTVRLPDRELRRDRELRPGRLGRRPRAVPRRRRRLRRLRLLPRRRGARLLQEGLQRRRPPSRCRPTSARSPLVYNLEGVDNLQLSAETARRDLRRQDHQVERPGDQGRQPRRRRCPATGSPRCTARTTPAPRTTSPSTSARPREGAWTPRAGRRAGRSRAARAPRAPPASSRRSRTARARSATPTRARPATSASPRSRSATRTSSRPPRRAAKVIEVSPAGRGPRRQRHGHRRRPHHDRVRRLPDRPGVLRDRLPDLRRQERRPTWSRAT